MFEIRIDETALKRFERQLAAVPRGLPRAMSRGLNRTATEARTKVTRYIKGETGLRLKDVRKRVTIQKATYQKWYAFLKFNTKAIYVSSYGARQTKKGVSFSSGRGRKLIRHAFIATMPSGHISVWRRRPEAAFSTGTAPSGLRKNRLPISKVMRMSGREMFALAKGIFDTAEKESRARLEKNINDQVQLILRRAAE